MGGVAEIPTDVGSDDFEAEVSDDAVAEGFDGADDYGDLASEIDDEASAYVGANSEGSDDEDEESLLAGDEEEEAAPKPKGSRAQKRIQGLSRDLKEARQRAAQYEAQQAQYQQQLHQIQLQSQQQIAEMKEQFAASNKELELMRQQSSLREEEGLDDVEKFRRQILRDAEQNIGKTYNEKLEEANRKYEELVNQLSEKEREGKIQQRISSYEQDANASVQRLLDSLPSEISKRQFEDIKTHVLNFSAYTGLEPSEGAREFDRVARTYVLSLMKSRGQKNGKTLRNGQAIPRGAPTKRRPSKSNGRINSQQAKSRGFPNALEAMIAENPPDIS